MSLYLQLAYIKKDESALIFSAKSAGYSTNRIACCPGTPLFLLKTFLIKEKMGKIKKQKALADCTVRLTQGLLS